ncbi:Uncharacterized protein BM_BM9571 [Brugia malayi]|uniref:Bm9571 n=2 Tax=Brugia malayi TaxID=6279 RepID=A0A0J9XSR2_BRUMA|nr:Uncharacterized protein BM_BM9571 [Brugia malayi]CDP94443.1 Bm9571 [Brugia malayi]VIO88954.1 Uncharacterized protein BM_BM9571 [Brugia malayi]
MYRAMRTQLQPFCTITDCNRSCHQVHRRNQEPSPPSVSSDFLKAKQRLLRRKNDFFVKEIGRKPEPVLATNDNSGIVFRSSLPTPERAITLEDIIKLARRKASSNCEEPSSQKHYVITDDKLPIEEPANQASEIVKDNGWTTDDWAYLEQLMELDADHMSLSSEPPITVDNDDDTTIAPNRQCTLFIGLRGCFGSNPSSMNFGIGKSLSGIGGADFAAMGAVVVIDSLSSSPGCL